MGLGDGWAQDVFGRGLLRQGVSQWVNRWAEAMGLYWVNGVCGGMGLRIEGWWVGFSLRQERIR